MRAPSTLTRSEMARIVIWILPKCNKMHHLEDCPYCLSLHPGFITAGVAVGIPDGPPPELTNEAREALQAAARLSIDRLRGWV